MVNKIRVVGTVAGNSGYDHHTRGLSLALSKLADVCVDIQGFPGWEAQVSNDVKALVDKKFEASDDVVSVLITSPPFWDLWRGERGKKIGFLVFEGSKIPRSWAVRCCKDYVDLVIVPSEHTRQAVLAGMRDLEWKNFDIESFVKVVPHGYDPLVFNDTVVRSKRVYDPNTFTFLFNKGWVQGEKDRSNLQVLLRAFCDEFGPSEPVRLLVKLNPAYANPGWDLNREVESLGLPDVQDRPRIDWVLGMLTSVEMGELYRAVDVHVMPSKAEAFSFPGLEAMACGVPTISTNYSGMLDYLKDENAWLIDGEMAPASDLNMIYEEANWMEISVEDLRKTLREAYQDKELLKKKSEACLHGRATNLDCWTWSEAASRLVSLVEGLS